MRGQRCVRVSLLKRRRGVLWGVVNRSRPLLSTTHNTPSRYLKSVRTPVLAGLLLTFLSLTNAGTQHDHHARPGFSRHRKHTRVRRKASVSGPGHYLLHRGQAHGLDRAFPQPAAEHAAEEDGGHHRAPTAGHQLPPLHPPDPHHTVGLLVLRQTGGGRPREKPERRRRQHKVSHQQLLRGQHHVPRGARPVIPVFNVNPP